MWGFVLLVALGFVWCCVVSFGLVVWGIFGGFRSFFVLLFAGGLFGCLLSFKGHLRRKYHSIYRALKTEEHIWQLKLQVNL